MRKTRNPNPKYTGEDEDVYQKTQIKTHGWYGNGSLSESSHPANKAGHGATDKLQQVQKNYYAGKSMERFLSASMAIRCSFFIFVMSGKKG
jgi:hypothetical protein